MEQGHRHWRRNLFAVTLAAFMGFTGFTLVMPFLPLYLRELGLTNVGDITLWTGLCLGVTPGLTAFMAPLWARLAQRVGRKVMVERSLLSFVIVMVATAYVTAPWQVLGLRTVQGFFAGYGALAVAMAAESAPPDRLAFAIGVVQTAQRLGPALGPVIGGGVAEIVGVRRAFIVSSFFYVVGFFVVLLGYREVRAPSTAAPRRDAGVGVRRLLARPNFALFLLVIFGIQFIDRSFGPILTVYVEERGLASDRVALVAGFLFALAAFSGAIGNIVSGWLLRRFLAPRVMVVSTGLAAAAAAAFTLEFGVTTLALASAAFGFGLGLTMTSAFAVAGGGLSPQTRTEGFGLLTSASLIGMATSGPVSGLLGSASIRAVFVADAIALVGLAAAIRFGMRAVAAQSNPMSEAPAGAGDPI